ncbi:hypothetical protein [Mucilaginibacter myungsuensis]|uniref:Porin n=1 Tax=Mucilaginibacter myungsuensis TaxID=649104 RepID=A0A929PZ11_9SPHI|nr:hypothetical protein [Mucilaginibacter myungsuensis]MBE9663907.1 hypothetical protein [Mucilaginibacter myungsuensis]MDN3598377.1 hypothetical protein [Mucilaginibacter myungsuensis]
MKIKHLLIALAIIPIGAKAQEIQYFRHYDQRGINVFHTGKQDTVPFTGLKVKVGGNFAMAFQMLRQQNTALPATRTGFTGNVNSLIPLIDGFNLPMANLNIDAQLSDGIRLNLTSYLSARHHEDTWVKGGYIQFDKLTFLHSDFVDELMKSFTIKIGQNDIDYGDQHFRRSDGGNIIYNPFVENYIMDAFTTEIGAEIYYHHKSGFYAMGGITNGELNPTVVAPSKIDSATGVVNKYPPAFHGKLGFDKQLNSNTRFRVSGSFYTVNSANSSTLYGGDRTGSRYYYIMSNQNIANGTTTSSAVDYNAFSGRLNPGFSQEVHALMGNLFLKHKGIEFFGTVERAQGRTITEKTDRKAMQYAADLLYRFPANKENFWVGGRYNTVTAAIVGVPNDVRVDRVVASAGWFLTKNIMMKAEYVNQVYNNYPTNNILNGGKFNGLMLEAAIGF